MSKKGLLFIMCLGMAFAASCTSATKSENKKPEETVKVDYSNPDECVEQKTEENTEAEEKTYVPDFEISLINGKNVNFSDFYGKKVLLNFWATWCGPCVGELPALQRLSDEYPDELVVLAVNCSEDSATVSKFIEKNGYTFLTATDENYYIQNLFGGITSIPVTIIIDSDGSIVTGHVGAYGADKMYEIYKDDLGL